MAIGTLTRGDDYVLKVTVSTTSVIDVTGDKFFFTIKTHPSHADVDAIHQDIDVSGAGADATAGIHRFPIPNDLTVGSYYYDVQWKRDASGSSGIVTIENSTFTVINDVTKAIT